MPSRIIRRFRFFAFALSIVVASAAETALPPLSPLPSAVSPSAELRAAAEKAGLSMGPLAFTLEPGAPRAGDGVVALITLWSGEKQKQWAVQFEIAPLTDEERKSDRQFNVRMRSEASGEKIEISATPTFALKIRALGPFATLPYNPKTAAKAAVDKTARAPVMPELLSMGLDQASRALIANGETLITPDSKGFKKLRPEEEKTVWGGFIALLQFFMIAQETPGLKEIALEIIDLPSLWSLARGFGKINAEANFGVVPLAVLDPAGWNLPTSSLYQYPFGITLNGKPAVHCAFFVTAPHPPLLTTAGILGFTAQSPSHKDKHMLVQIVSAYRGAAPVEAEVPPIPPISADQDTPASRPAPESPPPASGAVSDSSRAK